jgi:hypothetical protein
LPQGDVVGDDLARAVAVSGRRRFYNKGRATLLTTILVAIIAVLVAIIVAMRIKGIPSSRIR